MTLSIIGFGIGIVAYFSALISVANARINTTTFDAFVKHILFNVYALILIVFLFHMLGKNISFLLAFCIPYFGTLCFIDYEDTYDNFVKD